MLTPDKTAAPITVDLARLPMLLTTLHLPTIGQLSTASRPAFRSRGVAGRPLSRNPARA